MKNLRDLILDNTIVQAEPDPFFAKYGLRRNPFPPNRTILPEVLYDQEHAIARFAELFRQVLAGPPQRRALAVLAGTGGGKTHFMRHCCWNAELALGELSRALVFVEFQAGSGKLQDITREILNGCDLFFRNSGGEDFVTVLVRHLSDDGGQLDVISQDDLRFVLENLVNAYKPGFKPKDRAGQFNFDALREISRRWLNGASLSQTEKKYVGVISRINTASYAVRVVTETLKLARHLGLFEGLVLCLDEIETVFTRGSRASQYQSFLTDLRYLYDESVKNESGYSLLLLSASTQYGANLLRQVNYPVFQRLGFEQDQRVVLQPVTGFQHAKLFAEEYIKFERHQFDEHSRQESPAGKYPSLLSDDEIEQTFLVALGASPAAKKDASVNQAPLLDALHRAVEEKRAAEGKAE